MLWWGGVLGPQQCLDGWCMSSGLHMNASTRGFPAEHRIGMAWSTFHVRENVKKKKNVTLIIPISDAGIDRAAKSEERAVQVNRDTDEDEQEKEEEQCDYWGAAKWKEEWFRVSRPVPRRGMKECYLGVLEIRWEITISTDGVEGRTRNLIAMLNR